MPIINKIHNNMYTDTTVITYKGRKLNYREIGQAMDGIIKLIKNKKSKFEPGLVCSTTFNCRDGKHHSQDKTDEKDGKDRFRTYAITISCEEDRINFVIEDGEVIPYKYNSNKIKDLTNNLEAFIKYTKNEENKMKKNN